MAIHGKNGYLTLNSQNVSGFLDNKGLDKTNDVLEVTTFGSNSKSYINGLQDATFSLSGNWDATIDGYLATMEDLATIPFLYAPQGNSNGNVKFTGNALITSFNISQGVNDKVTFSLNLQVTGGVTRGVV
jgi:hypothetical protein